jgi:hypothetical protein
MWNKRVCTVSLPSPAPNEALEATGIGRQSTE